VVTIEGKRKKGGRREKGSISFTFVELAAAKTEPKKGVKRGERGEKGGGGGIKKKGTLLHVLRPAQRKGKNSEKKRLEKKGGEEGMFGAIRSFNKKT